MEIIKANLKSGYTVVHLALLYMAVTTFSDQSWMPLLLIIPFSFFAYITFPGFEPQHEDLLVWMFGIPLLTASCGFWMLKEYGLPDGPISVALAGAVFMVYIFATVIAWFMRAFFTGIKSPEFQRIFARQPVGFLILLLVGFLTLLALVEMGAPF